jgi:hypothetical protein
LLLGAARALLETEAGFDHRREFGDQLGMLVGDVEGFPGDRGVIVEFGVAVPMEDEPVA